MIANHLMCRGCRYRLKSCRTCELGAVDKPSLCPRARPAIRVAVREVQSPRADVGVEWGVSRLEREVLGV